MPDSFETLMRNNEEIRHLLAGLHQGTAPPGCSERSTGGHLMDRLMAAASRQEAVEERLLPWAARRLGPDAARIIGQAVGQSRMIKQILAKLAAAPDADPGMAGQVSATLAAAWREHIDFEERQVLPLLRQACEPAVAAQAEEGGGRDAVTAALDHLRDVAESHDASGLLAVTVGQAPGRG
jgi:hypothetical protein